MLCCKWKPQADALAIRDRSSLRSLRGIQNKDSVDVAVASTTYQLGTSVSFRVPSEYFQILPHEVGHARVAIVRT